MNPTVGRVVHYVSHGTPVQGDGTQAFPSVCRAAIVTEVGYPIVTASLAVLNPTGMFFPTGVLQDACDHVGGTWHWPERETPEEHNL